MDPWSLYGPFPQNEGYFLLLNKTFSFSIFVQIVLVLTCVRIIYEKEKGLFPRERHLNYTGKIWHTSKEGKCLGFFDTFMHLLYYKVEQH